MTAHLRSNADLEAVKNPVRWLCARLEARRSARVATPNLPPRETVRAPSPSRLSSSWAARRALRGGVEQADFLRHRLALLLGALPIPSERLPLTISVEDGTVSCERAAPAERLSPRLEAYLRAEGAAAHRLQVQGAQDEAARLAMCIDVQRRRVEALARDLEGAARATELVNPADRAEADRMGRPPVQPPWSFALLGLTIILVLAEAWQLAVPCLEAAGLGARELGAELRRSPAAVAFGFAFALGAALSLVLLASVALRRGAKALDGTSPAPRRLRVAMTAAAGLVAAGLGWSAAGVRGGAALDLARGRVALFLTALALPVSAAWLLRLARKLEQARVAALAQARAWDQEHYRSLADLSRRSASVAEEEKRLTQLERERASLLHAARRLAQRVATAERLASDAAGAEEQELWLVAQGIAAALELDRYEYLRQQGQREVRRPSQAPTDPAPAARPVREPNLGLAS